MRAILVILVVCIASTFASQININSIQEKALTDFIINTFGLQNVWAEIQALGANLGGQFQNIVAQLLFAGQDKWQQAQALFNTLVYDLTNHIGDASTIVIQTINALSALLQNNNAGGKRDLADFFLNTLGLGNIWAEIQNVGAGLLAQFTGELTQLLFAGSQVLAQAKPILQQLAADLQNHLGNSSTILSAAVAQLAALLNNNGKRDLADFFLNNLGLGNIWAEIQNVGAGLLAQFTGELTQLLFAGSQVLAQAKPILQQLAADLQNHLGNSSAILSAAVTQIAQILNNSGKRGVADFIINTFGLQNVWAEIQTLGGNLVAQLQQILTQLLFAGQDKWQQAQAIFNTLIYDITNHIGDASTIVTQSVAALTQLLSNQGGKRGLKQLIH